MSKNNEESLPIRYEEMNLESDFCTLSTPGQRKHDAC